MEGDERLGQPICGDYYDYPAQVAFNWHAPELWRRFTITLRRVLAHRAGLTSTESKARARVSFVKVAEYQRRAVVQFHALVRLDTPGDTFEPCDLPLTATDLADAITEAASLVRLVVDLPDGRSPPTAEGPVRGDSHGRHEHGTDKVVDGVETPVTVIRAQVPHQGVGLHDREHTEEEQRDTRSGRIGPSREPAETTAHTASIPRPEQIVPRFGTQTDTQAINDGPAGELTPERVAAYIARYATKSAGFTVPILVWRLRGWCRASCGR